MVRSRLLSMCYIAVGTRRTTRDPNEYGVLHRLLSIRVAVSLLVRYARISQVTNSYNHHHARLTNTSTLPRAPILQ